MRWLRRVLIGLLAFAALFYGLGGWHFSNVLNERALDGVALRADYPPPYDLRVQSVQDDQVCLEPSGDEPPVALGKPGVWGLLWDGGAGRISLDTEDGRCYDFGPFSAMPEPGDRVRIDPRVYREVDMADGPEQDVTIRAELGDYPAWLYPGGFAGTPERRTWAIVLHGNSMSRLDGARAVPIFGRMGFPVLVPTYRNDEGAPEDPSGTLRYGLTEWQDLEAAVQFALDHGATDVILDGYSMGGGIIMAFLQRSDLADHVTAVVMDAPMLDFGTTVDDNASRETLPVVGLPLPSSLTAVAKQIAAWRFGVDWKELDYLGTDPGVPTLVFHGTEDLTVPIGTSVGFARRYPDVTLERCPNAGHIECWNVDPERYEQVLGHFLRENARVEGGYLSCPAGSLLGGGIGDFLDPGEALDTPEAAIEATDPGEGTLAQVPVPTDSQADKTYVQHRDGFTVRVFGLRHFTQRRDGHEGWLVESTSFCGDVGGSG